MVAHALQALTNLAHRGAEGADAATGDGAGLLVALPDAFTPTRWRRVPEPGRYAVGVCFLAADATARRYTAGC